MQKYTNGYNLPEPFVPRGCPLMAFEEEEKWLTDLIHSLVAN